MLLSVALPAAAAAPQVPAGDGDVPAAAVASAAAQAGSGREAASGAPGDSPDAPGVQTQLAGSSERGGAGAQEDDSADGGFDGYGNDSDVSGSAPARWRYAYATPASAVLLPSGRQIDVSLVGWAQHRRDVVELRINGRRYKRLRLSLERDHRTVGSVLEGSRLRARCGYRSVQAERQSYPVVECRITLDGDTVAMLMPEQVVLRRRAR